MLLRRTLVTLAILAVAAAAVLFWPSGRGPAPPAGSAAPSGTAAAAKAAPPAPPVNASVYVVRPSTLDNKVLTTGTLLAEEEVVLTSEASGKVVSLNFEEGATVRRGQLLAQLNDQELRAQLTKALSRLKLAQAQEYRQRVLLERQAISQQEYDVVAGELSTTKADVALTEAQLLKTQIRAPFDGRIGLRRVSAGSYVSPGTALASLQKLDRMKLEFAVPEKYANGVRVGERVGFKVRSSEAQFTGQVYAIEPKIDAETRSLTLRALTDNPNGQLLPGAFADVELVLARQESALLVPAEAIVPEQTGHRLFKVQQGKASPTRVTIGLRTRERVQVVSGLEVGDSVIVAGVLLARPGSPVTVASLVD